MDFDYWQEDIDNVFDLDITINDGGYLNGYVRVDDSSDLHVTTYANDHDHNSVVQVYLDYDAFATVDALPNGRSENEDINFIWAGNDYSDLSLEGGHNFDRLLMALPTKIQSLLDGIISHSHGKRLVGITGLKTVIMIGCMMNKTTSIQH